jgi:uncharacterized membrane protein
MKGSHRGAIISSGVLLGAGLGGFVDGILLHQILQWHNMLSALRPPTDLIAMKYNMVWDGLFHAFTWLMVSAGVWRLWRAGKRPDVPWSTRTFVGSLALGWGLFNFVEGLISHQLLGIHHVHPGEAPGPSAPAAATPRRAAASPWSTAPRTRRELALPTRLLGGRVSTHPAGACGASPKVHVGTPPRGRRLVAGVREGTGAPCTPRRSPSGARTMRSAQTRDGRR